MIVEEIVNEIDKFITKYKALKSDNQSLTQFKSDVKTALNSKGIIHTNEDSEVVQSITNYTPSTAGSNASLDASYLKSVGLLPSSFSGNPTERDLIVNNFLFQDSTDSRKFISSEDLLSVSVHLDGEEVNDYRKVTKLSTSFSGLDLDKYKIPLNGYYINEFKFNKLGNYSVDMSIGTLSLSKVINYIEEKLSSMDNFLVYATNLKSNRVVGYDTIKKETSYNLDSTQLDNDMAHNFIKVENSLNAMGSSTEKLGYVYNIRTGKAFLVDVVWLSSDFSNISSNFKKSLSTVIYNGRIDVLTSSYSFALSVSGDDKNHTTFISDIDYQDGDTLVFAFYNERNSDKAHEFTTKAVEDYLKPISSAISSDKPGLKEEVTYDMGRLVRINNLSLAGHEDNFTELAGKVAIYEKGVKFMPTALSLKNTDGQMPMMALGMLLEEFMPTKDIDYYVIDLSKLPSNNIALPSETSVSIAKDFANVIIKVNKDNVIGNSETIKINGHIGQSVKINGSDFVKTDNGKNYLYSFKKDGIQELKPFVW